MQFLREYPQYATSCCGEAHQGSTHSESPRTAFLLKSRHRTRLSSLAVAQSYGDARHEYGLSRSPLSSTGFVLEICCCATSQLKNRFAHAEKGGHPEEWASPILTSKCQSKATNTFTGEQREVIYAGLCGVSGGFSKATAKADAWVRPQRSREIV